MPAMGLAASLTSSFRRLLSRFAKDKDGNLIVIFALALLPMVGAVGAAVDYSRASLSSSSLQAATDGTALALSKNAATLSNADLQLKANDIFKGLFTQPEVKNVSVVATFSQTPATQITVTSSGTVSTEFMRAFGRTSMPISAVSKATWGNVKLRVALVLDTTGSMDDDGKMPALKTAAKNLLTQLQAAAAEDGDVHVSIIPFSKNVNVGASNYGASWIDWTDWEAEPRVMSDWIANNSTTWERVGPGSECPFSSSSHGFRCASNPTSTSTVDYIPSSGTYKGYICPSTDTGGKNSTLIGIMYNGCYDSVQATRTISTGSNASCGYRVNCSCAGANNSKICTQTYYVHNWIKNARSTWNGCITDRGSRSAPSDDYDRTVAAPVSSVAASLFPAEQNSYCSPQVMPLSYDWTGMKAAIDNLYPLGATNQPIGLVTGWQSLVGGGPFPTPPTKDARYQYNEVIILMSDGLNTLDRWYGNGSATNTSVDRRMYDTSTLGTCANVKTAGKTVYTIQVNTNGDPQSALLRNCATTTDKFWMVTTGGALNEVFKQIGTELSSLRLAL